MQSSTQSNELLMNDIGMEFGWQPEIYNDSFDRSQYPTSFANVGIKSTAGVSENTAQYVNAYCSLTHFGPFTRDLVSSADTFDPPNTWYNIADTKSSVGLKPPPQPLTHDSHSDSSPCDGTSTAWQPLSAQAGTPNSILTVSVVSFSPGESEKTRRARYAANKRHSKTQKARHDSQQQNDASAASIGATAIRQHHREKNKVAAAKCRSRRRKQVHTMQEKGSRLGEQNAELKTTIQQLRVELNGLRSMALDHQECNCHVSRYNINQAQRIVAEHRLSCFGHQ